MEKLYFDAAKEIFKSRFRTEKFLDNNSQYFTFNASTIEEAKHEIYFILEKSN